MNGSNGKQVLISGASFAGLSSAFWMSELGYDVTVVERAPGVRTGGTAVNIEGDTVDIARRMGILDAICANRLDLRRWDFKLADDRTARSLMLRADGCPPPDNEYEIERDVLMRILLDAVRGRCRIVYGDRIAAMTEGERVEVAFDKGEARAFDLVLGCDGTRSNVRRLWFGDDAQFLMPLDQYFSITIVDKLLIERDTAQMYNEPGKAVMLNAYKNKTDIIFAFAPDAPLQYDHRDEAQQRSLIARQFESVGWRASELLREVETARDFYFDALCQVRMPAWSKGRVALVGDAAYCPSPAAGLGGSLAIDGAAGLGEALRVADGDHALAFGRYDAALRPFVDEVQTRAVQMLETLVPRTEEAIRARNAKTDGGF
ncbi:FAD-dependent monooxygenase [Massilia sp. 9096]|uniref:FAD-dependent monooxygenase n=1 Tax=Massilia sp. 9096 TaxID=1500894 RepID=UPI00056262E3|nr:FAD-dependent monooxygenase [Massilia sp. 9096]